MFNILTDHDTIKWILNLAHFSVQLAGWHIQLSEFDFEKVHHAGIKHQTTDTLLLLATNCEDKSPLEDYTLLLAIDTHTDKHKHTQEPINERWWHCLTVLVQSPTITEILHAQACKTYCRMAKAQVGHTNSEFNVHGQHQRPSRPTLPQWWRITDRIITIALLVYSYAIRSSINYGTPWPTSHGRYARREFYLPHRAADVKRIVSKFQSCKWNNSTFHHMRKLHLFQYAGPLEFIVMDVFAPFSNPMQQK